MPVSFGLKMYYSHICSLDNDVFISDKNKEKRKIRCKEISTKNPRSKQYFRSLASIERERGRHLKSKYSYIIHPLSLFRFYWDVVFCFLFFSSLMIIPVNLITSFKKRVLFRRGELSITEHLELCFDIVSMIDMVVTFFTGYGIISKKEIVLNPRNIAIHYLTGVHFYFDLICCVPTYAISELIAYSVTSKNRYVYKKFFEYISSCLKFLRLVKFLTYFNRTTEVISHYFYIRTTLRFVVLIIILLHWFTCIHLMVELYFEGNADVIAAHVKYMASEQPHSWRFFVGRYFQKMLVTSSYILGIALISEFTKKRTVRPLNYPMDYVILIVYGMGGFVLCNLLWVLILQMIMTLNAPETKYYAILCQLHKYMDYKELPGNMRNRILSYYDYRFQKKYFRETTILDMLSETLKREIYLHSCRTLIESVSLLKDLPQDIISQVVTNLKHEVFLYNDIIVKAGTPGDCMYFIANGTVAVFTLTGKEICHLQDGAYFGEIGLISKEQKRVANVVAIEICEIYRLDRKNFKNCFPLNSPHYRRIEQVAQERMEKTMLLEELHKKYILDKTAKRAAEEASREIKKDITTNAFPV